MGKFDSSRDPKNNRSSADSAAEPALGDYFAPIDVSAYQDTSLGFPGIDIYRTQNRALPSVEVVLVYRSVSELIKQAQTQANDGDDVGALSKIEQVLTTLTSADLCNTKAFAFASFSKGRILADLGRLADAEKALLASAGLFQRLKSPSVAQLSCDSVNSSDGFIHRFDPYTAVSQLDLWSTQTALLMVYARLGRRDIQYRPSVSALAIQLKEEMQLYKTDVGVCRIFAECLEVLREYELLAMNRQQGSLVQAVVYQREAYESLKVLLPLSDHQVCSSALALAQLLYHGDDLAGAYDVLEEVAPQIIRGSHHGIDRLLVTAAVCLREVERTRPTRSAKRGDTEISPLSQRILSDFQSVPAVGDVSPQQSRRMLRQLADRLLEEADQTIQNNFAHDPIYSGRRIMVLEQQAISAGVQGKKEMARLLNEEAKKLREQRLQAP